MVRAPAGTATASGCSPHPRGDGPLSGLETATGKRFSPPAWGWSASRVLRRPPRPVLPTRVGMVRLCRRDKAASRCSPHPRGDGPGSRAEGRRLMWFSPPAWGWSGHRAQGVVCCIVLPTRVGMVRPPRSRRPAFSCSPHPRGDGPRREPHLKGEALFSPPAWGWSGRPVHRPSRASVLPTRVGMVRHFRRGQSRRSGSPHPRGDGPRTRSFWGPDCMFSPPAWGWSGNGNEERRGVEVLPTRVGMVRQNGTSSSKFSGSPHPRGDGPGCTTCRPNRGRFSPPAWGWSALLGRTASNLRVLPTRVGMVRISILEPLLSVSSPHPRGDGPG